MSSAHNQVVQLPNFKRQFRSIDERAQAIVLLAITEILSVEGIDLAKTNWLSFVGDGVWEFRIGKTFKAVYSKAGLEFMGKSSKSPLLIRVFCAFDQELIYLLGCYDKQRFGAGRRQVSAIRDAKNEWLTIKEKK